MSEYKDPQEALIDTLRAEMPPTPREDSTSRVRARILASRPSRKAPALRPSWRAAGGLAVTVAVLAFAVVLVAPHMRNAAFARERAVEALMFQAPGRVLHLEMTYIQDDRVEGTVRNETNERWSVWVDADGKRLREEFVDAQDGTLNKMHVRTDERDTVLHPNYPKETRLVEYDSTDQRIETALDDWIPYMRARIADGSAKVTGSEVIEGDDYWIVTCSADDGRITETVTLRKSDYLLKTWVREVAQETGGANSVLTKAATLQLIEQLDPSTLPEDFFSVDAVRDAAKDGSAGRQ